MSAPWHQRSRLNQTLWLVVAALMLAAAAYGAMTMPRSDYRDNIPDPGRRPSPGITITTGDGWMPGGGH